MNNVTYLSTAVAQRRARLERDAAVRRTLRAADANPGGGPETRPPEAA